MARMKTFFIYFLLVVLFFIYSQAMIWLAINGSYKDREVEIKNESITSAEVKSTSVNGIANIKIKNDIEKTKNKYIKMECISKHNIVMGTKYIKIDEMDNAEEKEYEIRFTYNRVEKAIIDIVDEEEMQKSNVKEEDMMSDKEMKLGAMIGALILLFFFAP